MRCRWTAVLTSTGNPVRPDLLAKEAQAAAYVLIDLLGREFPSLRPPPP